MDRLPMKTMMTRMPAMAARPRRTLDQRSKRFEVRFAIQLKKFLDDRGFTPADFVERLHRAGLDVSYESVKKWLSGDRLPRPEDAVQIGKALSLDDYRKVWPE